MKTPDFNRYSRVMLILAPLVLFAPVVLTGKALFWGTPALQFVPWRNFAWETLARGHLPLWNSMSGMGAPLMANYQSALLYPPNWLLYLLSALGGVGWLAWGHGVLVVFHLILAAAGMRVLTRQMGMGLLAQIVSSLAFSLCGYMVARAGFLSINATVAWLPWLIAYAGRLAGLKRHCEQGRSRSKKMVYAILLTLILTFQFLAGHAQSAWYALLLAFIWAGYWGWWSDDDDESQRFNQQVTLTNRFRGLINGWLWLAITVIVAIALTAVQLLPTAEYLLESQRAGAVDYEYSMTYSFWPWRFLTILAPDLFGNPVDGNYWGYGNYWEDAIYIGVLPAILALTTVAWWTWDSIRRARRKKTIENHLHEQLRTRNRAIGLLIAIIFVTFTLALGKNTPLFPWLYRRVPTFDMFQAPTRIMIWAELALALLAGYGIDSWKRPLKRSLYWTRLATAGAFAITLGAGLGWIFLMPGGEGEVRSPTFIQATALTGIWALGTGVLSLTAPAVSPLTQRVQGNPVERKGIWQWAVLLFVAADLVSAGWGLNPGIERYFFTQTNPTAEIVNNMLDNGRLFLQLEDENQLKFERFLRFDSFDPGEEWINMRAVLLPNLTLLDDIPSTNNFDPLVPARYAQWIDTFEVIDAPTSQKFLNLMGVGVVEIMNASESLGVEFIASVTPPRSLRWVPCVHWVEDGGSAWELVNSNQVDFNQEAVLETETGVEESICNPSARGTVTQERSQNPNELYAQVKASDDGWVVLADTWYPGWQVYMDGEQVNQYRANFLFRAVQVRAGDHQLRWVYQPASFWAGMVITMLAMGGCVLFGWLAYFRRRKEYDRVDNLG